MEITDKPLPKNIEAEKKIIGCLILNNSLLPNIDNIIQQQDFYDPNLRILYETICSLIDFKVGTTPITIMESLKKKGLDRKISGIEFIERLTKNISDTDKDSIIYYAKLIAENSERRKLVLQGIKLEIEARTGTKPAEEILKGLEEGILNIRDRVIKPTYDIRKSLGNAYDYLESFTKENKGIISTGFEGIDFILKGLKPPRVYIMGGLRGEGKTSFFIALTRNICLQFYKPLYFSLEMSQQEIILRMIQGVARVPNFKIEAPKEMLTDEWSRVASAIEEISKWKLVVCDGSYTINQFEAEIRDHKPDVIIIDHIDCMPHHTGKDSNVPFFLADVVVNFKRLAKKYNAPIVFASQLKESAERKTIRQYDLADYKGSRGKADTVDIGGFIKWNRKDNERLFEWGIVKNRFGRTGYGRLYFIDMYGTFEKWED